MTLQVGDLTLAIIAGGMVNTFTQPLLSWVRVKYQKEISKFPKVMALQPTIGIPVGIISKIVFLTLIGAEGWAKNPPGLTAGLAPTGVSAVAAFLAACVMAVAIIPTFLASKAGKLYRRLAPCIVLGAPLFTLFSIAILRLGLHLFSDSATAVAVTSSFNEVAFTIMVDVGFFEAIRKGWLKN